MIKGFDKYIGESGMMTTGKGNADHVFQPDYVRPRTNIITTSRGTAVPQHWSNSPAMSGGTGINYTLGANPKSKSKKNKVLTYKDFIGKSNSFSNRKK